MSSPVLFFGEGWDAPAVDDARQIETPIGEHCYQCAEAVVEGDRGFVRTVMRSLQRASVEPVHAECDLRSVMGHQVGICSCTGYDIDRRSARLVWQRVGELRGRPLEDVPHDR